MLTASYGDFNRMYAFMNHLRRAGERFADEAASDENHQPVGGWPAFNVYDTGGTIVLTADVPGLSESELQVTVTQDTLQVGGERALGVPDGYSVQRRERAATPFSRSVLLPWKIDSDQTVAAIKDGVLTVTLTKAPEAQPRRISVKAS